MGAMLDLQRDGPTIVDVPAGAGPGMVNDAYFRYVTDMGKPGPDRGAGGKYLVLPPGHQGEVPGGYHVTQSPSYTNWAILRGFLQNGSPDAAAKMWKEGLKIYPLSTLGAPPKMEFFDMSGKEMNTILERGFSMIQYTFVFPSILEHIADICRSSNTVCWIISNIHVYMYYVCMFQ